MNNTVKMETRVQAQKLETVKLKQITLEKHLMVLYILIKLQKLIGLNKNFSPLFIGVFTNMPLTDFDLS